MNRLWSNCADLIHNITYTSFHSLGEVSKYKFILANTKSMAHGEIKINPQSPRERAIFTNHFGYLLLRKYFCE